MKKIFSASLLILFTSLSFSDTISAQRYDSDLSYRKWRVTLVPPLSTNGINAVDYTAKYSINILGGYHGGLDGFELGTLFNYNKYYASGFQIAGLTNITNGNMEGVNLAGLVNYSGDNMSGIQVAGFGNFSKDQLEGIQVAGIVNASEDETSGLQVAGVANISRDMMEGLQAATVFNYADYDISGLQGAGIANIARDNVEGLQASGVFNYAGNNMSGLQVAGAGNISMGSIEGLMVSTGFNVAKESASGLLVTGGLNYSPDQEGLMISGVANISRDFQGVQFSSLINYSETGEGLQIGLINYAKEFEGVPIGFISYYGNGRKNFDVRYTDAGFTEVGFNLGTYRVYNLGILGYNTLLDRNVYRVGIAVGLEKNIQDSFERIESNTLFVNQEISVVHNFEEEWNRNLNLIYSYRYLIGKRFGNGFSIYGGPTYNIQITRVNEAADYTWYSLWSPTWKGRQYRFWVGFTAGIRFFKQKDLPLLDNWEDDWDW